METTLLPLFSTLDSHTIKQNLDVLLTNNRQKIDLLTRQKSFSWENIVVPLEAMGNALDLFWSPIAHLHAVNNTGEWRSAYESCQQLLADYATDLGQNESLYKAFISIQENSSYYSRLDTAQRKVISNHIRDFTLSGVALSSTKKHRYAELQRRLTELATTFENNIVDATDNWQLHITDAVKVAGIPERALTAAQETAKEQKLEGWVFNLKFPSYHPVITYADDRQLRQDIYTAYVTRASDQGPTAGRWDNSAIMDELLKLRHELATLLGFKSYANLSLATKMAKDPVQVIEFLNKFVEKARPKAIEELAELTEFAKPFGIEELHPWDIPYFSEKLRQTRYAISEEEIRPYFPAPKVIQGMFEVVKRLYGLTIIEKTDIDVWHPDVQFFEVYNAQKEFCGQFYLDLYARSQKRAGAWMDDYCGRWMMPDKKLQIPVAFLTCNFTAPTNDAPALLNHEEVLTLFHEFGHGLHHLLTQIDYLDVSGINGVPWDAVELPSQFMENWCWDYKALQLISGHYQTNEPLPEALFNKMHAAKNFHAGLHLVRQLEFSLFDFILHYEYNPAQPRAIQSVLDDIRAKTSVIKPALFNRFQHSFSHIFAGGYAAGYYSYLWANVLACDAFSRFTEEGIFNPITGKDFLNTVLAKGGSEEPLALFIAFRGREPAIEPLLKQYGLL